MLSLDTSIISSEQAVSGSNRVLSTEFIYLVKKAN